MNKVLSMIGLAKKAGKISDGAFLAEKAVRDGDACLLIVASDASENIRKKFDNASRYYKIDYLEYSTKELLGKCVGCAPIAVMAVCDAGFANAIEQKYKREL